MKTFEKKRSKGEGLYDPRNEHDSCGLGFIANIKGKKSPRYCPKRHLHT